MHAQFRKRLAFGSRLAALLLLMLAGRLILTAPPAPPAPKLKIASLMLTPAQESIFDFCVGIDNTGNAPAPVFYVQVYQSRHEKERKMTSHFHMGPIEPGKRSYKWEQLGLGEGVNQIAVVVDSHGYMNERGKTKHEAEIKVTLKNGQVVGPNVFHSFVSRSVYWIGIGLFFLLLLLITSVASLFLIFRLGGRRLEPLWAMARSILRA